MIIGIGNYYLDRYGIEEGARKMAEHGYGALDFGFVSTNSIFYSDNEADYLPVIEKYTTALKNNGIKIEQIHGPWRYPPKDATEEDRAERFEKMAKSLRLAKLVGAKYVALHPIMPFGAESDENPDEVYKINRDYYSALAKIAEELGVTICLENMPFREFPLSSCESIMALIKDISSPAIRFCFDTGHAIYYGEPIAESVKKVGSEYLRILHVHDNDGDGDDHLPPYEGSIDWGKFIEALYDIGYDGVLNLETTPKKYDITKQMTDDEANEKELALSKIAKLLAGN